MEAKNVTTAVKPESAKPAMVEVEDFLQIVSALALEESLNKSEAFVDHNNFRYKKPIYAAPPLKSESSSGDGKYTVSLHKA